MSGHGGFRLVLQAMLLATLLGLARCGPLDTPPEADTATAPAEPVSRLIVSTSDGAYVGDSTYVDCHVGKALFGIQSSHPFRCVTSTDGTTWTPTASTQQFMAGRLWALSSGTILAGADMHLYRSGDLGKTFTLVVSPGPGGFSEIGCPTTWSIADHGTTVIMVEYGSSPDARNFGKRILRSTDDGRTWKIVYDRDVVGTVFRHFHAVAYHTGLKRWVAATGDALKERRLLRSDDDGLTWANLTLPTATWVHPTALLDVGDPTRLLAGSDEHGGVYMLDVSDANAGKVEQRILHWPNTLTDCWGLWKLGDLYYASTSQLEWPVIVNAIYVSPDLVHWAVYHQFSKGELYVVSNAGVASTGKMQISVHQADPTLQTLSLSPAKVAVRSSVPLVREPATTNIAHASLAACDHPSEWGRDNAEWPTFDVATIDGSPCLRLVGRQPAFKGAEPIESVRIGVESGKTYIASAEVRGTPAPCNFATDLTPTPSMVFLRDDKWTRVFSEPFTATKNWCTIKFSFGGWEEDNPVPSPPITAYFRKVMLAEVPGTRFVAGGETRTSNPVLENVTTSSAWTDVFLVFPKVNSRHLATLGPQFIRSYVTEAGDYATVYFDPSDNTFALRRTVANSVQLPVKTGPQYFLAESQVALAVRSDGSGLRLSVACGHPVSHSPVDSPVAELNGARITATWGDRKGYAWLPLEVLESRLLPRSLSNAEVLDAMDELVHPSPAAPQAPPVPTSPPR